MTCLVIAASTASPPWLGIYKLIQMFLSSDIETSGKETKVRLRWHEHWQAHNSSKEAEEEVNVPTRTSRVQQVRAAINGPQ